MDDHGNPVGRATQGMRAGLNRLRALADSPTGRKTMSAAAVGLVLLLALVLVGLPGSAPNGDKGRTLVATGKDLFDAIMEQNPSLRMSSRIAAATEHGSATNLLVLPDAVWNELDVDRRNSLGAWLNTLGRKWNIQVGTLSEDGSRVLDPRSVITSQEWNRQVK